MRSRTSVNANSLPLHERIPTCWNLCQKCVYNRLMHDGKPLKEHQRVLLREIEDILRRVDAMPRLDDRLPEEILGYDDHGLPH